MTWLWLLGIIVLSIIFYIIDLMTALKIAVKYPQQFKDSEQNLALVWVIESKTKEEYTKRYQKFQTINIANYFMLLIIGFFAASLFHIDSQTGLAIPLVMQIIASIFGTCSNLFALWRLNGANKKKDNEEKGGKVSNE